jgi:hypothetical protein
MLTRNRFPAWKIFGCGCGSKSTGDHRLLNAQSHPARACLATKQLAFLK